MFNFIEHWSQQKNCRIRKILRVSSRKLSTQLSMLRNHPTSAIRNNVNQKWETENSSVDAHQVTHEAVIHSELTKFRKKSSDLSDSFFVVIIYDRKLKVTQTMLLFVFCMSWAISLICQIYTAMFRTIVLQNSLYCEFLNTK